MRLRREDADMAEMCGETGLRLYGREGYVMLEVVANFKYMGRPLY